MWPPSSDEVLLALRTVAIAFQRTMLRTRRSSASSTGCSGSSCGGIVFRYGVVPAGAGAAPVSWACPTTRSRRNCARSGPSFATTASSASSHSRVSWGSTSTCDAMPAPSLVRGHCGGSSCCAVVAFHLGPNRYGKAETHMVRLLRDGDAHEVRDLLVSVALEGDMEAVHLCGDNTNVLPTDTQKNTVYAFAREAPVGEIEDFALRLGRHFLGGAITRARVEIAEAPWQRVGPHTFVQPGLERRTCAVVCEAETEWVLSGLDGLVVMKSTGSEFHGFLRDRYTTLAETRDRILATAVSARWRHAGAERSDFAAARPALLRAFADTHSLSLQQTLYAMGEAVLADCASVVEVRLSLPNRHHFLVDLSPFGLENPNEVFHADDRPYGLIEGTVEREGAPPAGPAWDPYPLI